MAFASITGTLSKSGMVFSIVELWEIDRWIGWVPTPDCPQDRRVSICFVVLFLYSLFSPRFARVGTMKEVKQVLAAGKHPASHDRG